MGVFSPYVISLSDFAYYVFGQEPAVAMHLTLWYVLLVCHQYDVCENYVGSVYVGGYGGVSESGLCVFCKLCPVGFIVVSSERLGVRSSLGTKKLSEKSECNNSGYKLTGLTWWP